MTYLIDASVISEGWKPAPHPKVKAWIDTLPRLEYYVSVITFGELRYGADRLPHSRKRADLEQQIAALLLRVRVLPLGLMDAVAWGMLRAEGRSIGRELPAVDGLLLGQARAHQLVLASRDRDFRQRGLPIFDPWTDGL